MGAELDAKDKAAIRDLTEEAIATSLPSAELRRQRAELASLLGVSPRSLGSVSAYVNYSATEAITAARLAGRITNQQLVYVARITRESGTLESDLAVLAEEVGLSAGELSQVVALYEELYQGRPGGTPGEEPAADVPVPTPPWETLVLPEPPPTEEAPAEVIAPRVSVPQLSPAVPPLEDGSLDEDEDTKARGDTANYDFQAKRDWRAYWATFIRDRFGSRRLRDAKVICLPGREVEPEVAVYLAMGVRPENIYAVEGSRRVREEFVRNAERLGIRYYAEPLDKMLTKVDVRFDIVNYDFHGQFCRSHERDLTHTPLADDAILIYNAMAKREDASIKQLLGEVKADLTDAKAAAEAWLTGFDDPGQVARVRRHVAPASPADFDHPDFASTELGRLRREAVPALVTNAAGWCHRDLNRALMMRALYFVYRFFPEDEAAAKTNHMLRDAISDGLGHFRHRAPLAMDVLLKLISAKFHARIFNGCQPADLGLVAWHSTFGMPYWVGEGTTYDYLSETKGDGPRSRFLSTLRHIRQAPVVLADHAPAVDFAAAWTIEWSRKKQLPDAPDYKDGIFEVVDRRGASRQRGATLEWSDEVCVLRHSKEVARLRLAALRGAMLAATAAHKKEGLAL